MTTDETDPIMQHSEHVSKVQNKFAVLEENALTKAEHLLQCVSKNMQFFYEGNATNDGRKINANLHLLFSENMLTITDNLNYELEKKILC